MILPMRCFGGLWAENIGIASLFSVRSVAASCGGDAIPMFSASKLAAAGRVEIRRPLECRAEIRIFLVFSGLTYYNLFYGALLCYERVSPGEGVNV